MTVASVQTPRRPRSRRARAGRTATHLLISIGSIVMAYPLLYSLLGSFMSIDDYFNSSWLPIPNSLFLDNYAALATGSGDLGHWLVVTLIRVAWYIVVPGAIAVFCGYAFARLTFKGREALFLLLLSSMMFPQIVYIIPNFIEFARWPLLGGNDILGQGGSGMINTLPPLLLFQLVQVYYIFMFRQAIQSVPIDFEHAARVDGAGFLRVIWHVYLPMLRPSLIVLVIFQSVNMWNDYLWPLVVVAGNRNLWSIGLGVQKLMDDPGFLLQGGASAGFVDGLTNAPFAFALANVVLIPPIIVFVLLQRHFIDGMRGYSLKG